ncbi:aspartate aminotransferase family protein [Rhodophyticola sp. CCM32]|uniref:aspartate aminotransferase family protein n=1 Tax=Rhodophyticola sp. CCM32 TaxID=2916397 RepID=UPI00107F8218|nr:aspartate aminotransferase family protein [Rhodophyticola sp. CCM32]QBY01030.1 aspartate aminotransferase family protein [Rhodophyticola sp. CCM32]
MISPVLPSYSRAPLSFVKGEGAWLVEADGRRFLDFASGVAVMALGHRHPALVNALKSQADQLWHTSNLYTVPQQQELAEKLVEHTFADTMFFCNSGTEAGELAVKMARKYRSETGQPDRSTIIAFEGAFHGRSTGMISAAGAEKLTKGFGPLLPGFIHLPFGDTQALRMAAARPDVGAIIIEPIQGESGIRPVPDQDLKELREICDSHGLLLILDEIQCGMGRTGKLFAHEWAGITPDIMMIAKGIGGGFPIAALLATEAAAVGMTPGTHGSTYGGNPLGCAVASAVMDVITGEGFLEDVNRRAGLFRQRAEGLVASHPEVFETVRGAGFMLGLVCKTPNLDVINAAYAQDMLTVPAGNNVVRLLPPLTLTEAEIAEGIDRLDRAATALEAQMHDAAE